MRNTESVYFYHKQFYFDRTKLYIQRFMNKGVYLYYVNILMYALIHGAIPLEICSVIGINILDIYYAIFIKKNVSIITVFNIFYVTSACCYISV
jgi:hypothetical protein